MHVSIDDSYAEEACTAYFIDTAFGRFHLATGKSRNILATGMLFPLFLYA